MIGAFRKRLSPRFPDAFQLPILRRLQDFLLLKDGGGLVNPIPVNAHLIDAPYHGGSLIVNNPVFGVVGAFHIAIGRQRKRDTGITAQTLGASDFTGNIPSVPLVHNVAEGCKLIFALGAVHAVIDSDKPDAMLGKKLVRVKPHLQIVAAQPGHILDHHGTDVPVLDGLDHFGKAGAIEIRTRIPVVHKVFGVGQAIILGIS